MSRPMVSNFIILISSMLLSGSVALSTSLQAIPINFNYMVNITYENQTVGIVIDTGNPALTLLDKAPLNFTVGQKGGDQSCLQLVEDDTYVEFLFNYLPDSCVSKTLSVTLASHTETIPDVIIANTFDADNEALHDWSSSYGDIGLSYTFTSNVQTPFQQWLSSFPQYSTGIFPNSSQIFGLDFNDPSIGNSSIQLASILPKYERDMTWAPQADVSPLYHTLFIDSLRICEQKLFSNYSSNWPVLVDTGSVCLSLPYEIYNTFMAWFNSDKTISNVNELPSFSFLFNGAELHIPLSTLIADVNDFVDENGAPNITVNGITKKLCIIQGSKISHENTQTLSLPYIVFGTKVLHSMYFAADFQSISVGLARKPFVSTQYIDSTPGTGFCRARTICTGDQTYDPQTNLCDDPACSKFYFMGINEETKTCEFRNTPIVFGSIFVIMAIVMEVVAYFLLQYTSVEILDRSQDNNTFALSSIDPISRFLGKYITFGIDYLLVHQFQMVHIEHPDQLEPLQQRNGVNNFEVDEIRNEERVFVIDEDDNQGRHAR